MGGGSSHKAFATNRKKSRSGTSSLCMYFDDCKRRGIDEWEQYQQQQQQQPWILSRSQEKILAMEQLLGYTAHSASTLTDEQIEDETLHWAVDTHVIGIDDDDEEVDQRSSKDETYSSKQTYKYDSLSDLIVASRCTTVTQSLALLWQLLSTLFDKAEKQGTNIDSSVHWVVFHKCDPLWDYDTMVQLLQAISISKPQLSFDLDLDLFHPEYKHSPRMWSPETHAPFPTVAIRIRTKEKENANLNMDMDKMRSKLQSLFDKMDAIPEIRKVQVQQDESSSEQVLQSCREWMKQQQTNSTSTASIGNDIGNDRKWLVETYKEPYQLYATLWTAIAGFAPGKHSSTMMVVTPNLDAQTTHRVAVTVNAALQRLAPTIRIANVFYPAAEQNSSSAPHAMIHLVQE
jgi:hypothetical protein